MNERNAVRRLQAVEQNHHDGTWVDDYRKFMLRYCSFVAGQHHLDASIDNASGCSSTVAPDHGGSNEEVGDTNMRHLQVFGSRRGTWGRAG